MSTVTPKRPRVKPARSTRVAVPPSDVNPFSIVVITQGHKQDNYCVQPIPSDFGHAYEVEKIFTDKPATYHVCLNDDGRHVCDCPGHTYRNRCRHVEGLLALRKAGQL